MATFSGYYRYTLNGGETKTSNNAPTSNQTIATTGSDYILGDSAGETFTIGGTTYSYIGTATTAGSTGFLASSGGTTYYFTTAAAVSNTAFSTKTAGATYLLCFYPGTLIATPDGARAVETLSIGDLVLTAEGESRPVRWMGRQTVTTIFGDKQRVLPIRIQAGALGENLPARDLLVSPDHALLVEGVLVQAGALVNGTTITREAAVPASFTYYHVELADHSLILAEGVPAETFVDNVERLAFDNWAEHEALYGDLPAIPEMALPRAKAARQVPMAVRRLIEARARALGAALNEAA